MINGATINGAGKVYIDVGVGVPALYKDGLPYTADGALMIITSGAIQGYSAGVPFSSGKPYWVASEIALPAGTGYNSGFAVDGAGKVYYNTTLAVASHNQGWPIAANGTICASTAAPVANAFTNGFSPGFD